MLPLGSRGIQALGQRLAHRVGGLAAHTGEHMGVSIEGDSYRGVPQEVLDELGVDIF